MDTDTASTRSIRRRRRLRRAALGLGCAGAVALLLYAALPWLIPARWITGQLHYTLSELTGRPVRIERLSIGWRQGVVIEGLTIARKPAYGDGQMLRVGRARCGFTPLRTLFTGQVDRLEISDADCWAVIGASGRLNLTDLGAPPAEDKPGRLPARHWQLDDIRLHLVSDIPGQPEVVLDFGSLACHFDPQSGEASYSANATLAGQAGTAPSRILWDGKLSIPSLNPDVSLTGGTEFRFSQLDLSSLPAWVWPKALGIASISGTSSGRLATNLDDREGLRFTVDLDLHDVRTQRESVPVRNTIGDLSLDLEGGYRADSRAFTLNSFALHVPERLTIRGPQSRETALSYAPLDREWLAAEFRVHTPDVSALIELTPLMQMLHERMVTVSGPGDVNVSLTARADGSHWSLDADLTEVRCIAPQAFHHDAGTPARLHLTAEIDSRDGALLVHNLNVRLADDEFRIQARLPGVTATDRARDADQQIVELFAKGEIRLDADVKRAERLIESLPALARVLHGAKISGPIRAELEHRPTAGKPRLDWRIVMPEEFRCFANPYLELPGGRPVIASGQLRYPSDLDGTPGRIGFDLRYGTGRLHVAPDDTAWQLAATRQIEREDEHIAVDLHARVPLEVSGIETLLACSPWVAQTLAQQAGPQSSIVGNTRGEIAVNASIATDEQQWRLSGTLLADALGVRISDWINKPANTPARLECGISYAESDGTALSRLDGALAVAGGRAACTWTRRPRVDEATLTLEVSDAAALRQHSPAVARLLEPYGITGTGRLELAGHSLGHDAGGSVSADLTGLAFEIPGRPGLTKRAGVPLSTGAHVNATQDPNAPGAWRLDLRDLHLALGGSSVAVPELTSTLVRPEHDPDTEGTPAWRLQSLTARGSADVLIDGSVLGMNPTIDEWIRRHDCAGRGTSEFSFTYGDDRSIELDWRADATRLHVNAAPLWMKPAGMPVESNGNARLAFDDDGALHVTLGRVDGQVGNTSVIVRGNATLNTAPDGPLVGPWSVDVQADCTRLDEWSTLVGDLHDASPSGSAIVHMRVDGTGRRPQWRDARVHFANAAFKIAGEPIWLDGDLTLSPDRVSTGGLRVRVGDSDAALLGSIDSPLDAPVGELVIRSDRLDVDAVGEWIERLAAQLPMRDAPASSSSPDRLWALVDAGTLDIRLHSEKAWFTEPSTDRRFLVDELSGHIQLRGGVLQAPVRCSVNGGVIDGQIGFDRTVDPPMFLLDYVAREVQPLDTGTDVDVRPYLALTFPGLEPTGPITLIDSTRQRLLEPVDPDNYPIGAGELIIEGGIVVGKAAPDYITQLFPKLDFARFEFIRMHDWFEKFPDGGVEHHFVFQGPIYHIYADGVSTADRRIRYEVGVDFLASFDKESWAKTGQGRLPLFTKEGVISPDGRLLNERVRYVPLWKLANTIFVSNNIIETGYLALREQIRRSAE